MAVIGQWRFSEETLADADYSGVTVDYEKSAANVMAMAPGSTGTGSVTSSSATTTDPLYGYDASGNCKGIWLGNFTSDRIASAGDNQEQFDVAGGWSAIGAAAITINQYDDPLGNTNTADQYVDTDTGGSTNSYVVTGNLTYTANTHHQLGIWVKKVADSELTDGNFVFWFEAQSLAGKGSAYIRMEMNDPVNNNNVGTDVVAYDIVDAGNGWYWCWFVFDNSTDTTGRFDFGMIDDLTDLPQTAYTSDTRGVAVWGAQCVSLGQTNDPKTYPVPYANTAVPRCTIDWPSFAWLTGSSWETNFGFLESFYYPEGGGPQIEATTEFYGLVIRNSGDATNRIEINHHGNGTFEGVVANSTGDDGTATTATSTLLNTEVLQHAMMQASSNDLRVSANGSTVVQDTTVAWPWTNSTGTPNTPNQMYYGWYFGGGRIYGHWCRDITFYDSDNTDAEMVTLTTDGFPYPTAFSGTVAGDGGVMWPPRANDPRWTQLLTDSGITQSGNFMDDVKAALIALSGASGGSLDDLWKKTLAANAVTDISEPYLY